MSSMQQQDQGMMSLTLKALNQILDNQVTESFTLPSTYVSHHAPQNLSNNTNHLKNGPAHDTNHTISYQYITPFHCHGHGPSKNCNVQESTSTLLAAQALAQSNRTALAWDTLRSFFVVQGKNGFLPKYRYAAQGPTMTEDTHSTPQDAQDSHQMEFIDTACNGIPAPNAFGPLPNLYQPCPPPNKANNKAKAKANSHTSQSQKDEYSDSSCHDAHHAITYTSVLQIHSSRRLSALPLHASVILDIFLSSSQRMDDIVQLEFYWHRLYIWHEYWMEEILGSVACRSTTATTSRHSNDDDSNRNSSNYERGCYNIIHPWESLERVDSPLWDNALQNVISLMEKSNWNPPPLSSTSIPNTPAQNAMAYLLECHKNVTLMSTSSKYNDTQDYLDKDNYTTWTTHMYEQELLSQCPFAMLDISHLSILERSNIHLLEIGILLQELHSKKKPTRVQMKRMEDWIQRGEHLLEIELYQEGLSSSSNIGSIGGTRPRSTSDANEEDFNSLNEEDETWKRGYFSHVLEFDHQEKSDMGSTSLGPFVYNSTRTLLEPAALTNLLASWNALLPSRFQESIVSPLLERRGKFRFDCPLDIYPVPVWGECAELETHNDLSHGRVVNPALNYWLGSGLEQNGAQGLGRYIQNSTLRLVCNRNPFLDSDSLSIFNVDNDCPNATFAPFFTTAGEPIIDPACPCSETSTLTAAVTYNLLSSSNKVPFRPPPPIQQSWVLLLIVVELTVAFTIGLSCLLVSLNLMRRLHPINNNDEDGVEGTEQNTFLHLLRDRDFNFGETLYEETEEELEEEETTGEYATLAGDTPFTLEAPSSNMRRLMTFLRPF